MLIGRFLGALAAACLLSLPAIAQIQALAPHRALYKIRPAPTAAGTLPANASGTMAYELTRTCDGLGWRQHMDLTAAGGGRDIRLEQTWSGGESLDGKRYRFETRSKTNGATQPVIRGSALGALNGEPKWVDSVMQLMDAVDTWIPIPPRDTEKPLLMSVEDVFSITGRGTVATGRIELGVVKTGDPLEIIGMQEEKLTSTCTGVEMFKKLLDRGEAGDNVGMLLRGIEKDQIRRGMVIAKPGSITPHTEFKGEIYVLKKEEGGRHTPFHNKYRPQFYFRTTDVTGEITMEAGREMVMPGDNVTISVKLIVPIAMSKGLRFAIREGGRTVGAGQVTEIIK